MRRRRSLPDVLAGGIFAVIGGVFVVGSLGYDRGTPLRMGPGYFPLLVGAVVTVLGLAIVVKGLLLSEEKITVTGTPWRAIGLITVAVVFFGVFVRELGFVLTSFVTALLTAFASRRVRPLTAPAVAAGLTVAATLIFIVGLQLRLPMWGW